MLSRRMKMIVLALALSVLTTVGPIGPALAVEPGEVLSDPALESRARKLSAELRCLVCQNQSIDDSNAPLAKDLRVLVRERLVAGDTDHQVMDYVVARYGEFVLLRPPFGLHTLVLWLTPALVIAAAVWWIATRMRTPPLATAPAALSADERRRLERLLADGEEKETRVPPS